MFRAGAGSTRIDVRSVWLLLLYASEYLGLLTDREREKLTRGERDNDLVDALAEVLCRETASRMRSMLAHGYRARTASLTRVRGRIDHLGTARRRLMESGRILCTFHEQTVDLPRYRYLLVTLRRAAHTVASPPLRQTCLSVAQMLEREGVRPVDPTQSELSREQYGHADSVDSTLVALARLIRQMCAPEHRPGTIELPAIIRDEHALRRLFEAAVRGYCRFHLQPEGFTVGAGRRVWPAAGSPDELALLPRLNVDVLVAGQERQLIVECKFGPIFDTSYGSVMIKPGYLRQLYAYARVFCQEPSRRTEALLLGALVHRSPGRDLDVVIDGIPFHVRQVDLSLPPSAIRRTLDGMRRFVGLEGHQPLADEDVPEDRRGGARHPALPGPSSPPSVR